jgi:DNA polymerase-3 subunit delta
MLFLYVSKQKIARKKPIEKLLNERLGEINAFNYEKIDGNEANIEEIILSCASLPFGENRKAVLIESPFFLSEKAKDVKESQMQDLNSLLSNASDDIDIILSIDSDLFSRDLELSKIVLKKGKVFDLVEDKNINWTSRIIARFESKGCKIDYNAAQELANRIKGDLNAYVNEVNKLMLYSNHIHLIDVMTLVNKPLEDNVFAISNALLKGYNMQAFDIYRDLKTENVEPVMIIAMLGNQFRFVYDVKNLSNSGLNNIEISKRMKTSEIRCKIACQNAKNYSNERLLEILVLLADLDYKIKSGQVDRFYSFELFLINF